MDLTKLEAMSEEHYDTRGRCIECVSAWPCDAARLAKALRIMLGDDFYSTERERRAAALSALDEA
jgi:hypothetical protein